MSTFVIQRMGWSLQTSKPSRAFAFAFSTALPRRQNHQNSAAKSLRSSQQHCSRHPRHCPSSEQTPIRSIFTSARSHQQQEQTQNAAASSTTPQQETSLRDLTEGFDDQPIVLDEGARQVDWTRSFHGLSTEPFPKEVSDVLLTPISSDDIEIKPDGIIYLPEIKYRRILNKAFGPGGWGLAPRGETIVTPNIVTREYALLALGRLVSVARGEMDYFSPEGIPKSVEGCKSNALMRCCKDLGVASELWDPRFIRKFVAQYGREIFVEHVVSKKRKKIWLRKDDVVKYPFKETKTYGS